MTHNIKPLGQAIRDFDEVRYQFRTLCEEARKSPVTFEAFAENKIAFDAASNELYRSMFLSEAGTGVQLLRKDGSIEDLGTPLKKE